MRSSVASVDPVSRIAYSVTSPTSAVKHRSMIASSWRTIMFTQSVAGLVSDDIKIFVMMSVKTSLRARKCLSCPKNILFI